jgi:hypothetical protein
MPFANAWERDIHYAKHGHEFGAADPAEYERLAERFMFGARAATTRECIRPRGLDRIRFNFRSYHEAVARLDPVYLKTFFVVGKKTVARHGGPSGYFAWDCGRVEAIDV